MKSPLTALFKAAPRLPTTNTLDPLSGFIFFPQTYDFSNWHLSLICDACFFLQLNTSDVEMQLTITCLPIPQQHLSLTAVPSVTMHLTFDAMMDCLQR